MAAHSTFAGLKRLAARAGIKIGAGTDTDPEIVDENEDEDGEKTGDDDGKTGDDAGKTGDDDAGKTPEDDDGKEGEGNEADDDTTTGDETDGPEAGKGAGAKPVRRSAEFLAGQRYGSTLTAGRFAAVLVSPVARANLEMATDLLANSDMKPGAIIEHCDRYKGEHSAKKLLEETKKVNLGDGNGGGQKEGTEAATSRQAAVKATNRRVSQSAKNAGVTVRPSRRAAAAGKPQEK
jgi:hypothetical protein